MSKICLGASLVAVSKVSACNAEDLGSIPGLGKSPGGEHGNPFQYSCGENPHGQGSLVGCSPGGCKESDMTEQLSTSTQSFKDMHIKKFSSMQSNTNRSYL